MSNEIKSAISNAEPIDPPPHTDEDLGYQNVEDAYHYDFDFPDVGVEGFDPYDPETLERIRRCANLDQNDTDNGARLMEWYGDKLLHVTNVGWYVWNDKVWDGQHGDMEARRYAQLTSKLIKLEGPLLEPTERQSSLIRGAEALRQKKQEELEPYEVDMIRNADKAIEQVSKRRTARTNFAVSSGNLTRTKAMVDQSAPHMCVLRDDLDADQKIICLENGVLYFERSIDPECPDPDAERFVYKPKLRQHDPKDLITMIADVAYDPKATAPRWLAFLEKTQPDPIMRKFLQVWDGSSLLGGNGEQKMAYHYGTGSNGKSAYSSMLGRIKGDYHWALGSASVAGVGQVQGSQHSADLIKLRDRRFVTVEELPKGTPLREELIKLFTGGTTVTARDLFSTMEDFKVFCKVSMMGNSMPQIMGTDYGIWRRLLIVPWKVRIPESERRNFDEVMEEFYEERSGILNWLIEGAQLYLSDGLTPYIPSEVQEFTEEYQEERSPIHNFTEACLRPKEGGRIVAKHMFKAYEIWCNESAEKVFQQTTFGRQMAEMGFKKERKRVYTYLDVEFTDEARLLTGFDQWSV